MIPYNDGIFIKPVILFYDIYIDNIYIYYIILFKMLEELTQSLAVMLLREYVTHCN